MTSVLSRPQGLLLVMVIGISAVAIVLSNSDERPTNGSTPRDVSFRLSDSEAEERLLKLKRQMFEGIHARDVSHITSTFTHDSPMAVRSQEEIHRLLRDDVIERTTYETLSVDVISNDDVTILLREISLYRPCFITEDGEDITRGPRALRQKINWTLRRTDSQWLIYDARVVADDEVPDARPEC